MEKVLEKVRKLIALATCESASEGERENALRMAHNLLAKHNLEMVDLENHVRQEGRTKENLQTFGMHWCRQAAKYIGELFFCQYFYGEKLNATKMNHYFVGKESNAVTASLMTEYVIASILREGRKLYGSNLCPETRNFAVGAVDTLYFRIRAMKKTTPEGVGTGTSIVLADYYAQEEEANMAWLKSEGTSLVNVKSRAQGIKDHQAYNSGREYGNKINLSGQIENPKTKQIGG